MRQTRTQMSPFIRMFSFVVVKKSFLNQTENFLQEKRKFLSLRLVSASDVGFKRNELIAANDCLMEKDTSW